MDVSVTEVKETVGSQKMPKTYEDNKDFISYLPDPILVHILSFLPLRDAIKTVLFRQFGNLWISMPVLDLDNCLYHEYEDYDFLLDCDYDNFMDVIHQVCNHHNNTTLDKLHLKLCFEQHSKNGPASDYAEEKERAAADQIENLVVHAISRKVKILDLDFKCRAISGSMDPLAFYEFPDLFRSNYLTDLRLASCDIRSFEEIYLPALRVLFLEEVLRSYDSISRLLQEVRRCKTFTPCTLSILVLSIWKLKKIPCPRFEWKNLRLTLDLTKWHHLGLALLLKSSQTLETLSMYISHNRFGISQFVKAAHWIQDYEFNVQKYWDLQEAEFPFLESITVHGDVNEPSVIQVMKFLLKSAPRLRKMVISAKNLYPAASGRKNDPYSKATDRAIAEVDGP
ncbi:UNVERIFIED_CONTAM: putative F-box/FBD/LRR-repeat protein [Sesamum radiatum]|uniref:F-box/FBD/LRR-repeat protein n=1 Tax=Sesamum radiatum TaxID=300843 RepID=A0AAW2L2F8_SESRA